MGPHTQYTDAWSSSTVRFADLPSGPMSGDARTFLVRHGEVHNPDRIVYADLDGFALSDLGRAQAAATASRLPSGSTLVASPLERAVETAEIIAAELGSVVTIDENLTEWHLGRRWAGQGWDSLDEQFPGELTAYLEHPSELPFSPESLDALAHRTADAVRNHREVADGPLVIISHQDPIQAARLALTGRPLFDLQLDKPGHAAVITLEARRSGPWVEREVWTPDQGAPFPPIEP